MGLNKRRHKTIYKDNKLVPEIQARERNLDIIRTIGTVTLVLPGTAKMILQGYATISSSRTATHFILSYLKNRGLDKQRLTRSKW